MQKQKKTHIRTVMVVVFVLFSLATAFYVFRTRLNTKFRETEERNLAESAKAVSEIFYIKLDDQLVMLESQVRYFRNIDLTDYNAMKSTIMSTKGIGEFKNIGVANASGATINYNGTSSGNILLSDYYQEAMQGNHAISKSTVMDEDGDEVLVLAVPIQKEDHVAGVIYGTFTKDTLNSILDSITFSDKSSNLLFNHEGKILAKVTASIDKSAEMIGDVIPDVTAPDDGSTASFYYSVDGKRFIAVMVPIGIHDWYFTNIMPESVVTDQTTQITIYVGLIIGVVIILFLIILLHVLSLIRSSDRIADINERFRLVNDQSHNIVFSYDYRSETATIEGNASRILSENKPVYTHESAKAFLELIHPEDMYIKQEIQSISQTNSRTLQGEFRLKNIDNQYYWYRLNATIMRDENGKPLQLLGSIFDVDEQRNKEIRLMEQASTDSLTGILNKGAFQKQFSSLLRKETGCLALYIIDLDNFKAVNDNLGHAMGDKVLTDVADKLSDIFGNKECVGRIGGDEFSAFFSGTNLTQKEVAERGAEICKRMQETYSAFNTEVHVSVSIGAAIYPADGTDYETLYKNADKALYQVKENGKNMYALYQKEETAHD